MDIVHASQRAVRMGLCCPAVSSYRFHLLCLQSRLLFPTAGISVRYGGGRIGCNGGGTLKLLNGVDNEVHRTIAGRFEALGGNGVRLLRSEVGLGIRPSFRSSSNRIWAVGGEHVEKGFSNAGFDTEEFPSSSFTNENQSVSFIEEDQAGSCPVRVAVKQNFNKSGSSYEISTNTESCQYTNKRTQRFQGRTNSSSSETPRPSAPLQGAVSIDRQSEKRDPKMPNAKRAAPYDQQNGDDRNHKKKKDSAESELRRSIDMCSKFADVMGAIEIYDKVVAEGKVAFNQYTYNVLLYLCSSAATGSLRPGKSGTIDKQQKSSVQGKQNNPVNDKLDDSKGEALNETSEEVVVTDEERRLCLERGFVIYEAMKLQEVPPNEATFTAVARLAVAKEDGDLAFDMVKQMANAKLSPRLRSYSPALHIYCKLKNFEKAFEVEEHMLAAGVQAEESELEALLQLATDFGLEYKVYSLLHRIRTTVRGLSPSCAGVVQQWFESSPAASAGKSNWDSLPSPKTVKAAYESRGGGWHGLGWLGRGNWEVKSSVLDTGGVCQECGQQLVTIDIDPNETEMFAKSLSELACQREGKNNEFKKFQAWLNRHGPFDAIVDGANVGLFNQNFVDGGFNFHQLNSVVKGIKEKIGSKRNPLILLHHRRTRGGPANSPHAIKMLKRWQEAHAIFTTPTGSNDDWYWLYAAVQYKCVLVTNDEMRDHLFHLLGNDFFPKWKERHQVRFSMSKEGPVYHMPPPYSILIQESVSGSWHIPKSGNDVSQPGEWLCVTRPGHAKADDMKEEKLKE
nr:pentatricopeptide repeat protein [Physcomitrium patens]